MMIETAHAAAKTAHAVDPGFMSMLPMLAAFMLIFYFLMIRPQQKKAKAHQQLMSDIKTGDEVSTTSGMIGKIVKVEDATMVIEIAKGVEIKMQKSAIAAVMPKGTVK